MSHQHQANFHIINNATMNAVVIYIYVLWGVFLDTRDPNLELLVTVILMFCKGQLGRPVF
jgi:hypothetical protein